MWCVNYFIFCLWQVFDLKEIDFVILLYGFGAAYLELGGHEVNNIIPLLKLVLLCNNRACGREIVINWAWFYFQELREAKKQFDIIVVEHKNVVFPLAYLGSGRVFYKQNRYDRW